MNGKSKTSAFGKNNGNPHFLYEDKLKTGLLMLNPCFIKVVERFLTAYIWVNLLTTKMFFVEVH